MQVFFTFYGLQLLRKDLSGIAISPLANPAMPMPVPMPVIVQMLPGMEWMACQMTVDLFEFEKKDFIDGIEYGGAATFMKFAGETDVCLFI